MNQLKPGDKVVMNNRYYVPDKYKNVTWTVKSESWDVCDTQCILLDGFRGGYAVDGLDRVITTEGRK